MGAPFPSAGAPLLELNAAPDGARTSMDAGITGPTWVNKVVLIWRAFLLLGFLQILLSGLVAFAVTDH